MSKNPAEKIEQWAIERLVPYARNARTHSSDQVAQIAASIKEWGWTTPILVDETGNIIAGHGRTMAARQLNIKEVPVMVAEGWSDTKKRAYILADNKLALNAGWDNEMLALELSELQGLDFDLDLTGFSAEEIAALMPVELTDGLTDEDAVPEVPVQPVTVPGDVWVLGKHRLMCGDSTSIDAVDKLMAGGKADMVFTDPPYGVSYTDSLGRSIKNDELTDGDLQEFLEEAFASAVAVSVVDSPWYVWHASRYQREFENALNSCGVQVRQQIIWAKGEGVDGTAQVKAPAIGRSDFRWLHEPCFYASRGNPFNAGDRKTTTVWTVSRPTTGTVHPTQKPIPLIEIALDNSAKSGATVLDLFGGSGSTLIACEKTGRTARLMELDPKYCDVIIKRWQDFTGKIATHAETGQPFAEVTNGNGKENN
jgi:DNA modification methylase